MKKIDDEVTVHDDGVLRIHHKPSGYDTLEKVKPCWKASLVFGGVVYSCMSPDYKQLAAGLSSFVYGRVNHLCEDGD
tara:strand:- start:1452 stop:1682 length:231 start_codon:yes stop_codon:yes gene_type:complete